MHLNNYHDIHACTNLTKCVYAYASPRARASQVSRVLSSGHSDNRSCGRAAAILVSAVRPTTGSLGALQWVSLRYSPLAEEQNPPWEEGNWSASHTLAGDLKFENTPLFIRLEAHLHLEVCRSTSPCSFDQTSFARHILLQATVLHKKLI